MRVGPMFIGLLKLVLFGLRILLFIDQEIQKLAHLLAQVELV